MRFIFFEKNDGIGRLRLERGKVNALNLQVVDELRKSLESVEHDSEVKAVIITGSGNFFSFGFDIPEFRRFPKSDFKEYLIAFTDLYTYMFLYPKPMIAALNGHTIAGGCMLALACDHRIMVREKAKISLNEIDFGSSVFAGSTEMLRFWVGDANATRILYSGEMFYADSAGDLGLVHEIVDEQELSNKAEQRAMDYADKYQPAFASIKNLLRKNVAEQMMIREEASINEFVDIWYSEQTWANIQKINIR